MNRRTYLLAAFVAGVAGAAPWAGASPAVGAHATCGFASEGTAQDQSGAMYGGPWAADVGGDASIRCTLRLTRDGVPVETLAIAESGPSPAAVVTPTAVAFTVPFGPGYNVEMCTEITVHRNGMPPEPPRQYDADGDPSNGAQCAPATRHNASNDDIVVYAAPNEIDGDICAYVDDQSPDPPSVCVPWGPPL